MTCRDAHEYLFAFLDSELDAALSIEFQRHIEHCPACAREVEIERAIRRRIETAVDASRVPAPAMSHFTGEPGSLIGGRSRLRPMRRGRAIIAGFAAVVLLGLWGWLGRSGLPSDAGLADHLVSDFEHFLAEGLPVQTSSSDPGEVAGWLRKHTDVPIQLASTGAPGWRLTGGRKCVIDGRVAAFAAFERERDGAAASVVAIVASADALRGMSVVRRDEETHWVDKCRGHTVVAGTRGGLVYAVVSQLPEEDLLVLLRGEESDRGSLP